jgi:hypothetical protein
MFRNFGIDVLPSSVLLNNAGIVVAKDFNAYNAPDILSKIILADQKAKGNYRSKNLILSFNQKDSILNSVMLSKVDSLIDQMKDLLIFDIKLTSNNELTFEQMCDIQEYLISEGIPSSRISSCQRETNNHSENSSDIINRLSCKVILHLEWVPGKIPLKSTASSNNFNNPCGMFGDIRKMNEWEIGDSLFFCYLQLDVHPDDYTLCSSHPETLAELNCLIAIMTKNKNLKFELTMVKSFTAYRPEFGVKSFKTILNYLVSKGIDPNRIKFREVAADINKINFPCARFIINAPIRWYLRIIDV